MPIETVRAKEVNEVIIEAEFSAVCPLTKTTDEYRLILRYVPSNGKYVEFVSFKKYLEGFKDREILHEELAATIAEEVCLAAQPIEVHVELWSVFWGMRIAVIKRTRCQ